MDSIPIAIIGFSGRFPGAENAEQLWNNLSNKVCSVTEIPLSRWDTGKYWDPDPRAVNKSYSKWGGILDDIDRFDAGFFNILPSDAIVMDPQHRLVLEESWKTLEMAGYTGERLKSAVCGLYVGCMGNDYYEKLLTNPEREITATEYIGNSHAILSARLAYHLDLKGPTLTVDTACSSSLVCTHLACEALRSGDADIMLAGGVTLWLTETPYISMSKASMLSPTGRCKTFDDSADGFVPGESVCFVLLKRLPEAIRDGDSIYGVIKGSGINQDGKSNGISAPNLDSQHKLIEQVYQRNNIDPASIQYVETHGTGTKLGDPVEFTALSRAFSGAGLAPDSCVLGALKSNLGHTSAASGVAGLIKVLLSLKEKTLVPNVNFHKANTLIDFSGTPFCVLTEKRSWSVPAGPRRAALSSFGFSGTNAHMVIEEAPERPVVAATDRKWPFPVSSRKPQQLHQYIQQLSRWLKDNPDARLQDISFTLCLGRRFFAERALFWADSLASLSSQLQESVRQEYPPEAYRHIHEQFIQQHAVDWAPLFNGVNVGIVALPGQIFEKSGYWLPSLTAPESQKLPHQLELPATHPVFSEHCVNNIPVLPGAAILNFISWQQHEFPFSIKAARWLKPLTVRQQQSVFLEETPEGRIMVKTDASVFCFTAIKQQVTQTDAPWIIPLPPQQAWSDANKPRLYAAFRERGLHYTGAFQRIDQYCRYDDALYTSVSRSESCVDRLHRETSFLDGILQIVLLLNEENEAETRIPYSVESWICYGQLPDKVIIRAQQQKSVADVIVADTCGRVLQTFSGIRLEKLPDAPRKENTTSILVPQETAVPLPDVAGDKKTLYLDSPSRPVSPQELNDIDRIVILFTENDMRTFSEKLNEYVAGTFTLLKTLQRILRQKPLSLEYHLLSQSPVDYVVVQPLSAILKVATMEHSLLSARLVSSQRIHNYKPLLNSDVPHATIKKGSTWLITGGTGALGFVLACELARKYQARLLLCGRSEPSHKHQKQTEILHALGGQACYHCVDCTDYAALSSFINHLTTPLNGVIHCAGVLSSGLIKNKTPSEVNKVIAAKVAGTLNLDLLTQGQPLDFFILTSSVSSLCPTAGLSDYSYGNSFLNYFARHRSSLVSSGKRRGRTLSVCCPHWNIDGMPLMPEEKEWWWLRYGLKSLTEEEGVQAFIQAMLTVSSAHCVIAKGDMDKFSAYLNNDKD
ncbi:MULTISPECIES: SDR family NAD(P)-dependent oxidoreductase [Enterobacter cloacae complex]|uniref:SDR family NAD(P)-dependent oxidoreductase n=1 Tax=Enterobacter cloacae complex TaxID=354276 RepID=UPI00079456E3|nr:SDR family NAD(P)-dependent oxidoreductase [Enterobacter ludwigii]WNI43101.1 SDR family NAD(P)-dependent oxidoreductase [Enterobacter ludwigii]WNI52150.1 SDR family NAD(P)-dependent oxidoreductase [Enterobacter ludwigii]WNI83928.1 SDR family NAD(P)-dependent oxidoreductase [Enterobacter ludwigii]SAC79248.1 3-oxoacyl-[acyl-carrier-protein] synthase %3B Malonyl CoA-acyl carrier protein transacylase [Enterobacter ludwigii]